MKTMEVAASKKLDAARKNVDACQKALDKTQENVPKRTPQEDGIRRVEDRLEVIYSQSKTPDFVEIKGEIGGEMPRYVVITKNQVYESEPEKIVEEQEEKRKLLGLDGDHYVCHFFDSPYFNDSTEETSIEDAIQRLAIKDGYDMVQFQNGNYGFVAYYNGIVNGFEIIG